MTEIFLYEKERDKLKRLCDENDLEFLFLKDEYPIRLIIKPRQGLDAQISILEEEEEAVRRSPHSSMTWTLEDGVLTTTVSGGTFSISKGLRTKIETVLVKMIVYWQQFYFRNSVSALRMRAEPVTGEPEVTE